MDDDNDDSIMTCPPDKARKKMRKPHLWKRNEEKIARHSPKQFPQMPTCIHKGSSVYRCRELSLQDVRRIHSKYYEKKDLASKKEYILQHVEVSSSKRRRLPEGTNSRRKVSTFFSLPKRRSGHIENVRVCRNSFLKVIQESHNRVQKVCQKYLELGVTPPETRGGARILEKNVLKREAIKEFIKTFKPIQKHYCRGKNVRQYLPSELNITNMWKMYSDANPSENLKANYEYFRTIFEENFNIGFSAPYTDKCSTCTRLKNEIDTQNNQDKKTLLKNQLKSHKVRADRFYTILKENNVNELVLTYDCQKNLVLPKVPDQAAYYKRQLYVYNFTICQGSSLSPQNQSNTFSYVWTENMYPKGSNQITSAVYHRLTQSSLEGITVVKLFSDGCGGQNKNKSLITMLSRWLLVQATANVEKIVVYFPIVGHSFIPPDRVFGKLENQFKPHSVIENPQQYIELMKNHCTIIPLGDACSVQDWKLFSDEVCKVPGQWHFQFQKSKKITITRTKSRKAILVQGEPFYEFESCEPKSITKKGKSLNSIRIADVPKGNHVKPAKIADVKSLLCLHYGVNWKENKNLNFYTAVFNETYPPLMDGYNDDNMDLHEEDDLNVPMEVE